MKLSRIQQKRNISKLINLLWNNGKIKERSIETIIMEIIFTIDISIKS